MSETRENQCLTSFNPRFQQSPREKHRNGPLVFPVFIAELEHQFPLLQNSPNHEIDTDDHVDQDRRCTHVLRPYDQDAAQVPGMADDPVDVSYDERTAVSKRAARPSHLDLRNPQKPYPAVMPTPGNEQIDGNRQEEDLNKPQGSFPAEDRRFTKHVGIVDKGDERHQRHDIIKQSVKAKAAAEFLFCEICHRCGD